MTSRTRNLSIIGLVLVLLAASAALIVTKPTVLGLDLRGGVELVYEGRPTPQAPKVTPQSIDDAIDTIRKRTDALGVSEPEIQRAGSNQISIGLPNVSNADRAIDQVGTTAQLQFYDWEPNVLHPGRPRAQTQPVQPASAGAVQRGDAGVEVQAQGRGHRPPAGRAGAGDQAPLRQRQEEDPALLRPAQRHQRERSTTSSAPTSG